MRYNYNSNLGVSGISRGNDDQLWDFRVPCSETSPYGNCRLSNITTVGKITRLSNGPAAICSISQEMFQASPLIL